LVGFINSRIYAAGFMPARARMCAAAWASAELPGGGRAAVISGLRQAGRICSRAPVPAAGQYSLRWCASPAVKPAKQNMREATRAAGIGYAWVHVHGAPRGLPATDIAGRRAPHGTGCGCARRGAAPATESRKARDGTRGRGALHNICGCSTLGAPGEPVCPSR
jgi:hypothetical protein